MSEALLTHLNTIYKEKGMASTAREIVRLWEKVNPFLREGDAIIRLSQVYSVEQESASIKREKWLEDVRWLSGYKGPVSTIRYKNDVQALTNLVVEAIYSAPNVPSKKEITDTVIRLADVGDICRYLAGMVIHKSGYNYPYKVCEALAVLKSFYSDNITPVANMSQSDRVQVTTGAGLLLKTAESYMRYGSLFLHS